MKNIAYAGALSEAINEEMERDDTILMMGEDVGNPPTPFGITAGLIDRFGPKRVKNTPISESAIVGAAVGASATGLRPIVEIMFIDFVGTCMDQIFNQAAKMRYMFGGQVTLPMVIRTTCGAGFCAAGQHSQSLEAWFAHVPGLKVVMPSTPYDAKGLLKSSIRDNNPVVFIENKVLYASEGEIPEEDYVVPIGEAEIKREGKDVTVVTWSRMVQVALSAADRLKEEGIDVEVVDLRTIAPLDKETILNSVEKTGKCVVFHEACRTAGFGAEVAAIVADEAFDWLDGPIKRVTGPDTIVPFSPPMETWYVPDEENLIEVIKAMEQEHVMSVELIIPKLGMTMKEATITTWVKSEGDWVEKGDVVFEIQTEKVNYEVEAMSAGYLHIMEPEGATRPINARVGLLFAEKKDYEAAAKDGGQRTEGGGQRTEDGGRRTEEPGKPGPKIKISPVARRIAKEHGLDPASITGTGPGGRIVKEDVLRAMEEKPAASDEKIEVLRKDGGKAEAGKECVESIPIQGVRRVIFDNMYQSLSQSAQLTLHTDACAEAFLDLRKRLSANGQKISYNAILMKIAASAIRLHPKINVSVDGDVIQVWQRIHIGLAMEANDALIVPVVGNPDRKTIRQINANITELVLKTKENRLTPDDFANGTFTISNLGFADIDHFTPIIRPPENAILGVGRIVEKPVVRDGRVVPEARIGLSLTFDHRITDGAPAARFLKDIKEMIEDPVLMLQARSIAAKFQISSLNLSEVEYD